MAPLNQVQFSSFTDPDLHGVVAHVGGHEIGSLYWRPGGEVTGVSVDREHQRRGIATEMWHRARAMDPHVRHSGTQTKQGRAWARKVGD